jgi:uncharacterized membrane protein YsdA (DUF1294 family)
MCYYIAFGLLCIALMVVLIPFVSSNTDWNPYTVWLASLSITSFAMYGIDKGLSKVGGIRTPEFLLHLLAVLGGFAGAGLGMVVFRHKTNIREHPEFLLVIALSACVHLVLGYHSLFGGG